PALLRASLARGVPARCRSPPCGAKADKVRRDISTRSSLRTQGPIITGVSGYASLELQRISTIKICGYGPLASEGGRGNVRNDGVDLLRLHFREPVIQGIARTAHGSDGILLAAGV